MRLQREEANLLSIARKELLLRYASRRGYLRFARVNRCKVSHDEVIGVSGALGKGGSPYIYQAGKNTGLLWAYMDFY